MILQVEIYWLCRALAYLLRGTEIDQDAMHRIATRLSLCVQRLHSINDGVMHAARGLNSSSRPMHRTQGQHLFMYAHLLERLEEDLSTIVDRSMLLSLALLDPCLPEKCAAVEAELQPLLFDMYQLHWYCPLACQIAVTSKGTFINSADSTSWPLTTDMAWGCFSNEDALFVGQVSEEKSCHLLHPVDILCKLNVPNYILWACAYGVEPTEDVMNNGIGAIIARYGEVNESLEPNSPFPDSDLLRKVAAALPSGVSMPSLPAKNCESIRDVLVGKENVINLQLHLMKLIG